MVRFALIFSRRSVRRALAGRLDFCCCQTHTDTHTSTHSRGALTHTQAHWEAKFRYTQTRLHEMF